MQADRSVSLKDPRAFPGILTLLDRSYSPFAVSPVRSSAFRRSGPVLTPPPDTAHPQSTHRVCVRWLCEFLESAESTVPPLRGPHPPWRPAHLRCGASTLYILFQAIVRIPPPSAPSQK